MDQDVLGKGAMSQEASGDIPRKQAIFPSLRTLEGVGEGFPQPQGLEYTCITLLLVTW